MQNPSKGGDSNSWGPSMALGLLGTGTVSYVTPKSQNPRLSGLCFPLRSSIAEGFVFRWMVKQAGLTRVLFILEVT
jgi:hypothetical protein